MSHNPPADARSSASPTVDQLVVRHHQTVVGGATVRYTSTTGRIVLHQEKRAPGEPGAGWEGARPRAEVFFVAYARDGVAEPADRPVTFSFNGGPGSSSVWLHLGLLGPKRVRLQDDGMAVAPPYALVENEASLLDVSDLVFIDPSEPGTAAPPTARSRATSTASTATSRASATSSASGSPASAAGRRPSS
jgi:carboxypeptidase C (cathepsin A)